MFIVVPNRRTGTLSGKAAVTDSSWLHPTASLSSGQQLCASVAKIRTIGNNGADSQTVSPRRDKNCQKQLSQRELSDAVRRSYQHFF